MQRRAGLTCALLIAALPAVCAAGSPRRSTASAVQLVAVLPESLGLQAAEPSIRLSMLSAGIAEAAEPVTLTTRWNLEQSRSKVVVYASFDGPSGTTLAVEPKGAGSAGQPQVSFPSRAEACRSGRNAGPGMEIVRQALTSSVSHRSSRTDALQLLLQFCSAAPTISANDHGTVTFLMQAY